MSELSGNKLSLSSHPHPQPPLQPHRCLDYKCCVCVFTAAARQGKLGLQGPLGSQRVGGLVEPAPWNSGQESKPGHHWGPGPRARLGTGVRFGVQAGGSLKPAPSFALSSGSGDLPSPHRPHSSAGTFAAPSGPPQPRGRRCGRPPSSGSRAAPWPAELEPPTVLPEAGCAAEAPRGSPRPGLGGWRVPGAGSYFYKMSQRAWEDEPAPGPIVWARPGRGTPRAIPSAPKGAKTARRREQSTPDPGRGVGGAGAERGGAWAGLRGAELGARGRGGLEAAAAAAAQGLRGQKQQRHPGKPAPPPAPPRRAPGAGAGAAPQRGPGQRRASEHHAAGRGSRGSGRSSGARPGDPQSEPGPEEDSRRQHPASQ